MTKTANHTELSIGVAKRRIQALEQLILEQPSGFDDTYYKLKLAETLQVLAQLNASLEQPAMPLTADAVKKQLERVHTRLRFADQTLADPATDEHLRGFVKGERERLLEVMNSLKAELQNLDPKSIWKPQLENPKPKLLSVELNLAQEEARRISQLRETLLAWISRLPLEHPQHQSAQDRLATLEVALEVANAEVERLNIAITAMLEQPSNLQVSGR